MCIYAHISCIYMCVRVHVFAYMCITCIHVTSMISCTCYETGAFDSTTVTLWSPVARSDIAWNFEKFLIGKDGEIIERFSRFFPTADIAPFIEKALK